MIDTALYVMAVVFGQGYCFAAWDDAADGLLDIHRLGDMLRRIEGNIVHRSLEMVSPLAVPVMLEIGRESIAGDANESLLAEAAEELIEQAMRRD